MSVQSADVVIVGAGFFGLRLAQYARESLGAERVIVLEREDEAMTRASYVNQARVHNGYHYPRSILTAYRSRVSSADWAAEYEDAVYRDFTHYYGVASRLSKVTARQFEVFCERIGASLEDASGDPIAGCFAPRLVQKIWRAQEYAFDSRRLRAIMLDRLDRLGAVELRYGVGAERLEDAAGGVKVTCDDGTEIVAPLVVSSVYSQINTLHRASGLPLIPLQLEITEMALIEMPPAFRHIGITLMDGPFFSAMPFPSRGLHTLSHVRYTPHARWVDTAASPDDRRIPTPAQLSPASTTFREMIADVRRYVPALATARHVDSMREVKAVLANDDRNDSRPILVRANDGLAGYVCVMGGKIDNVNDVLQEISTIVASRGTHHGVH